MSNTILSNPYYIKNETFDGVQYRLANWWFQTVPLSNYVDRPINYLEIGTFFGANLLSVADSYGIHKDSKLYCIDPWEDYEDYPEYKDEQNTIYGMFLKNIEKSESKDKIVIKPRLFKQ